MSDNPTDSPDMIERDIERTQDRMGDTVDRIEEKLTPKEVTRAALGDDGQELVREALRMTRENPVPVAMIAVGAIWLLATSGSPLIKRAGNRLSRRSRSTRPTRTDFARAARNRPRSVHRRDRRGLRPPRTGEFGKVSPWLALADEQITKEMPPARADGISYLWRLRARRSASAKPPCAGAWPRRCRRSRTASWPRSPAPAPRRRSAGRAARCRSRPGLLLTVPPDAKPK